MNEAFEAAFTQLRERMLRAAPGMVVNRDGPGDLELRTPATNPKTGEPGWFGTVTVKKGYVAYHLIPLYAAPELADGLSPELARRRQGKTCFNFKKADPALFDELEGLTQAAAGHVAASG